MNDSTYERADSKLQGFLDMLRHMRPEGSKMHRAFCVRYLEPVFGPADLDGNYTLKIGKNPRIMFTAHSDTVHAIGGFQKLQIGRDAKTGNDTIRLHPKSKSNCLGADDTSGIYLILEMIAAGVPGLYCVFNAEEIGCKGSRAFAEFRVKELAGIEFCISFDRKGFDSVITHQSSGRTCSDQFANDLAGILGADLGLKPDPTGSYTDSNEFAGLVSECTNLSVGYLAQHTAKESQDWEYLQDLAGRLIRADWDSLRAFRDCSVIEIAPSLRHWREVWADYYDSPRMTLEDICRDYPDYVADWLGQSGMSAEQLIDDLGIGGMTGRDLDRFR